MKWYAINVTFKKVEGPFSRTKVLSVVESKNHQKGGHYVIASPKRLKRYQAKWEEEKAPPKIESDLFEPDIYDLETEWQHQPKFYFEWCDKLALAKLDQSKAEANLDIVTAEIDLDIRNKPEAFGIGKVSEKAIASCLILQDGYKNALAKVHAAKHWADLCQSAVRAAEHRKNALENCVDLLIAGHHADVRPKHDKDFSDDMKRKHAFKFSEKPKNK